MDDPQTFVIVGADGTEHEFPVGMDPKQAAGIVRSASSSGASDKGSAAGPVAMATGAAVPAIANGLTAIATSPTAPATASALANGLTTAGAIGHGLATGNMGQIIAAPMEGWAAGKGGYFLAKGAQKIALPLASMLDKAVPYAQALSTGGAALSAGEATEPGRRDAPVIGSSITADDLHMTADQFKKYEDDHPALLNLVAMKTGDAIKALIADGLSLGQATRAYWNLKAKAK